MLAEGGKETPRDYERRLFFRYAVIEARSADADYGDMQSHQEGLGVLLEEIVEYAHEAFNRHTAVNYTAVE